MGCGTSKAKQDADDPTTSLARHHEAKNVHAKFPAEDEKPELAVSAKPSPGSAEFERVHEHARTNRDSDAKAKVALLEPKVVPRQERVSAGSAEKRVAAGRRGKPVCCYCWLSNRQRKPKSDYV
mmetsp:Transcript_29331/g.68171  ORF Transcript_29331/g.68171 Transcript_29331/m.68171 type:complete len:124 (+) Transcript_29331:46-417(+)